MTPAPTIATFTVTVPAPWPAGTVGRPRPPAAGRTGRPPARESRCTGMQSTRWWAGRSGRSEPAADAAVSAALEWWTLRGGPHGGADDHRSTVRAPARAAPSGQFRAGRHPAIVDTLRWVNVDGARPPAVLVIPGIGGHPLFHHGLLDGLCRSCTIHTAPHVDFAGEPAGWRRHVEHWLDRFDRMAAAHHDDPVRPAIVGI